MDPDDLARRIRAERKRRGWSMDRLAELAGTNRQQVTRWEKHNQGPGDFYAAKLGELFDLPSSQFIRGRGESAAAAASLESRLERVEAQVANMLPLLDTVATLERAQQSLERSLENAGRLLAQLELQQRKATPK